MILMLKDPFSIGRFPSPNLFHLSQSSRAFLMLKELTKGSILEHIPRHRNAQLELDFKMSECRQNIIR